MRMKITSRFATALLLTLTFCPAGSSLAGDQRFLFYRTSMPVPDAPPREGCTLLTESCQLVFLPPRDSLVGADSAAREIKVWYRDGRCFMKLTPSAQSTTLVQPANWEQLRAVLQARDQNSQVSAGSSCDNSSMPGCYFDVRHTNSPNMKLITRVAFVPYHDGMFEISLTATEAKFPAQLFAFNNFLNCLRIEKPKPDGNRVASN